MGMCGGYDPYAMGSAMGMGVGYDTSGMATGSMPMYGSPAGNSMQQPGRMYYGGGGAVPPSHVGYPAPSPTAEGTALHVCKYEGMC